MKKPSLLPIIIALSVCGSCIGIAAFFYWDLTRFEHPLPPLIAEPAVIDFGEIQGQDVVQGMTSVKNTTKNSIRILRVVVSCSCGDVKLRQGELLPGETTELSMVWDVHGRAGMTESSLAVVYVLDNGLQHILPVQLRANIIANPLTLPDIDENPVKD